MSTNNTPSKKPKLEVGNVSKSSSIDEENTEVNESIDDDSEYVYKKEIPPGLKK
jgi:hypothetical protein